MQTVFRKELQDDPFYSDWLKRQEETFKGFTPENVPIDSAINVDVSDSINVMEGVDTVIGEEALEKKRIKSYEDKKGLFIVHNWRPSLTPEQVADIVIWLQQHGSGPLSNGDVEKVEYQLGPKFFKHPKVKTSQSDSFRLEVSAYGPMLCLARVYIKGEKEPLLLERYINFEEASK